MLVSAISKDNIFTVNLPDKVKGQYWLYTTIEENEIKLASIEGINNQWVLKSNKNFWILNIKNVELSKQILDLNKIYLLSNSKNEKIFIFTEPVTEDRQSFSKYVFEGSINLSIGRNKNCDIVFNNKSVSSNHANLKFEDGNWILQDNHSTNGTFVNNRKIEYAVLKFGDCVFVMGLKIILGKNFIAINNPDGQVKINNKKLSQFIPQEIVNIEKENTDKNEYIQEYFFRSPRFKRDIETLKLTIDPPPNSPITDEQPMILVLGTSMTMGMMSVVTVSNAILNNNIMSMAMGGSMLIGTVLFPIITKSYEKNSKFKKEQLRQRKYKEYLEKVFVQIDEARQLQEEILKENIIPVTSCEKRILEIKRNLWDRSLGHNDFLSVRLGTGQMDMDAEISYPEEKFTLEDDSLQEELYMLGNKPKILNNVPITFSMYDDYISGVIGNRNEVIQFAKGLIIQLASMYSYDEVKMIFVYDKNESKHFDFVKWLPHVWSEDNRFRFIATNTDECKEVSAYIDKVIEERLEERTNDNHNDFPYYIIFSMDKKLALRIDAIKKICSNANINISLITFYNELNSLPKECSRVVELKKQDSSLYDKNDITGKSIKFSPDITLTHDAYDLSKTLANVYLNSQSSNFQLPDMITFLNLYGVGKVEHLNVRTRWKENDPTKSLAASVGVNTLGDKFMLDLHEKFHGPHGLVAGMTGSGKSEFIITYILSLAINYHPEEVQFVLIDYKGGGMAKSFEKLPHTVGIITNLDGASIKRSLVSIESELKRRQAIFSNVSKKVNVSNIDIYKYQKLYRDGLVDESLSHLFIISDEFAELKTQQPEFMAQLISAARIGRSLGVHLILATQKPSGVVDDQIWSNSRFRVCLKVQERADSQDMLKRPDAAELVETGRFYLQVGYNELFELGQSAWSGAPYYPSDSVLENKDESVAVIDNNAHILGGAAIDRNKGKVKNPNKQVDEITNHLCDAAADEGIHTRMLWLEPIVPIILVDDLRKKYNAKSVRFVLNPIIGEYDDPANQQQCLLRLPISEQGNVIVYGSSGSGKTTFLNAFIYSLINEHSPEEVNIYLLDFASETLRSFSKAPHVGDVAFSSEEEKINNLFKMLHEQCDIRRKLFADYGGDYLSYVQNSGNIIPSIVVAINNFAAFSELYDNLDSEINLLTRDGMRYGIYFIITAAAVNNVRFRLAQNFNQLFALQLNDETDYSTIVGRTDGLYPSRHKGRGLVKLDSLYEFQTASLVKVGPVVNYANRISEEIASKWKGKSAKSIPLLPEVVDSKYLKEFIDKNNDLCIPIGVETKSLEVNMYNFKNKYINYILSSGDDSIKFMGDFINYDNLVYQHKGWIFDAGCFISNNYENYSLSNTSKQCEAEIEKLFDVVLKRNNSYKTALEKGKKPSAYEPKLVYICSLEALCSAIDDEHKEKLFLILEKGAVEYNINIIISDKISSLSALSYESWYKNNVSKTDAIWIGAGIAEQYQIKLNNTTREMREHIGPEYGYAIVKGSACKLKVLSNMKG